MVSQLRQDVVFTICAAPSCPVPGLVPGLVPGPVPGPVP